MKKNENEEKQRSSFVSTTIPNLGRKKKILTTGDLPDRLSTIHDIKEEKKKNEQE